MATTVKILNDYSNDSLGTTAVNLYAPTNPRSAIITGIALTAVTGSPIVILKAGNSTTTATFRKATLSAAPVLVEGILSIGVQEKVTIQADSGTANIKAVVLGIERD